MIVIHLGKLMRKKAYEENRNITINAVAIETEISFPTLHKILNKKKYSTSTAILDKLCKYFNCEISDLLEYKPESEEPKQSK